MSRYFTNQSHAVTLALVILLLSLPSVQSNAETTLFTNAEVITLDPNYSKANSVLVSDGKIVQVGEYSELSKSIKAGDSTIDLNGATLAPGFIDAHGHLSATILAQGWIDVSSPPVASVKGVEDIVAILQAAQTAKAPSKGDWIIGVGYDDSLLFEQRHPTKLDLDKVSTSQPVAVIHVSGHFLACNSVCLETVGITAQTPDPEGGIIRRLADNEPDGVLEETAWLMAYAKFPILDIETRQKHLEMAQKYYARFGVTTVQDGAMQIGELAFIQNSAERDLLWLDVVAYPYLASFGEKLKQIRSQRSYQNHFRIGGVKLVLDGSPQGKTAWLSKPYLHPPHGQDENYLGYPRLTDPVLDDHLQAAFANGTQVLAHANGDAASDQLLKAVSKANELQGVADRRTVMIHAQTVREDQIDSMKELGVIPSYFSAHTFYWGDWHRDSVFGQERAFRISPLKSTVDKDILFTTHNDTPIVPSDMMRLMWASVNRTTRSGQVLGADQRITAEQALRSITLNAAHQYFEESDKGSITPGKLADMVVLSQNPLTVDPLTIKDIQVLATYKEGREVFRFSDPESHKKESAE